MSQPSGPGACKWIGEPVMPMVEGLLASGLINSATRVKLKEIDPNLKDEYQNRNLKTANKTSSSTKPATSTSQRGGTSKKISNRNEGQESRYQKRKLLHLNQSSKSSHSKAASPSLVESTSKYLSFATPPPNFCIQNNENANLNQYSLDDTSVSIGIPIDQLLLTKKRYIGKREIQRLLSDYMDKMNNYIKTIADSQMKEEQDPSLDYKELDKMLNITFATWNSVITTIRGYSDEYARLLYEIKKFFQKRVEKFPEIIEKYDEKITNLVSINNSQKEEIDKINSTIVDKDNEIASYNKTIEELTLKIHHLENDKEALNSRINDAEYTKEHIEEEYNTAVFRLTKSEEERKKSSRVLQSTQELLESCRNQIAHQEGVIGKYEEEGASFRPLYTRAASENQQYIKDLNDLREKMKNMVVKQETVNVEVQTNPVKIVNETKTKRTCGATRSTKKSSKKLRKQQSTVTVRNIIEKFDPAVLNSTATSTPENKKKKKKPSSATKQVKKKTILSPTNVILNGNNSADASVPTSANISGAVSPCLNEYMIKKQGILKSSEKFNPIMHCVSLDSASDAFDLSGESQIPSNFGRNRSHSCFSREQSHASFSREQSNVSFVKDQSRTNFSREQSVASFVNDTNDQSHIKSSNKKKNSNRKKNEAFSKSQSHLLNKENEIHSKCKSADFTPILSPIISQSCNQSQCISSESSSSTSPDDKYRILSPTKNVVQSPIKEDEIPTIPPDYNIRETFDVDSDTLISCVYRLLPLPLGTSSIFIHQADPLIENIIQNKDGNTSARLTESSIVPNYKSFNWLIQRIIDFFHSVINLDQTSNQYIDSVSMLRATISENTKIEALSERILIDVIKTALVYKQVSIVSVFLKVVTFEITTSEFKFLNMLFNLAFEYIYPSVQSLLDDPDLSPTSPSSQFLIHRSICKEIASKIFRHVEKDALEAVRSIESDLRWPDLIDFWEFTLKMISFFTKTHKQFQRQVRAILTLARLNSQTNVNDSINNDNVIVTKQNFCDFMIFIRPSIKSKEIEKIYNRFYLECKHRLSLESPQKGHNLNSKEMENEEAVLSSSTQYNFIRYCTDFPEITEDILKLKYKEDFGAIFDDLTMPLQCLLQFILKRFTDYTKFTQPRLLNPLLDMTKPVLSQMRNALLRCDTSMAFSCYRHVLQLIDLKCSEACPFTIFDKSIKIEDVAEATKLIIAREKIVAAHIFGNSLNSQFKKDEKENENQDVNKEKSKGENIDENQDVNKEKSKGENIDENHDVNNENLQNTQIKDENNVVNKEKSKDENHNVNNENNAKNENLQNTHIKDENNIDTENNKIDTNDKKEHNDKEDQTKMNVKSNNKSEDNNETKSNSIDKNNYTKVDQNSQKDKTIKDSKENELNINSENDHNQNNAQLNEFSHDNKVSQLNEVSYDNKSVHIEDNVQLKDVQSVEITQNNKDEQSNNTVQLKEVEKDKKNIQSKGCSQVKKPSSSRGAANTKEKTETSNNSIQTKETEKDKENLQNDTQAKRNVQDKNILIANEANKIQEKDKITATNNNQNKETDHAKEPNSIDKSIESNEISTDQTKNNENNESIDHAQINEQDKATQKTLSNMITQNSKEDVDKIISNETNQINKIISSPKQKESNESNSQSEHQNKQPETNSQTKLNTNINSFTNSKENSQSIINKEKLSEQNRLIVNIGHTKSQDKTENDNEKPTKTNEKSLIKEDSQQNSPLNNNDKNQNNEENDSIKDSKSLANENSNNVVQNNSKNKLSKISQLNCLYKSNSRKRFVKYNKKSSNNNDEVAKDDIQLDVNDKDEKETFSNDEEPEQRVE